MHVILTGATGLVGAGALHAMLTMKTITKVSIISRRPVPMADGHEKAQVFLQKDFLHWDKETTDKLRDAKGVVWALGVSQNDVNKEDYIKITKSFPLSFIDALAPTSPFNFVYVSGEGATTTPGGFTTLFGRVKGETEVALLDAHKKNEQLKPYSYRAAAVDETLHPEIHPFVPQRAGYQKILKPLVLPLFRATWKGMNTPTKEMGVFLTELATGDGKPLEGSGIQGEGRTISNVGFRRLAGLD